MIKSFLFILCLAQLSVAVSDDKGLSQLFLQKEYEMCCEIPTDINEHLPHLRRLASECSSVTEIGLRSMVSTRGILLGLSESTHLNKKYLGIDLNRPMESVLSFIHLAAETNGIDFSFVQANDLHLQQIEPVDMLFIDSLHTYAHLTYELETFSSQVRMYIAMHDTSEPFAFADDRDYYGDFSEYPDFVNRTKRGTWVAVWDFLQKHPEWKLQERYFNSYGFTVLKRIY